MLHPYTSRYHGGAIDVAFLGAAEVDESGNVNVSNFGEGRAPGCGGFIDISQTAKKVVFLGTLVGGPTSVTLRGGKLTFHRQGGEVRQCLRREILWSSHSALSAARPAVPRNTSETYLISLLPPLTPLPAAAFVAAAAPSSSLHHAQLPSQGLLGWRALLYSRSNIFSVSHAQPGYSTPVGRH